MPEMTALKPLYNPGEYGTVSRGDLFFCSEGTARILEANGNAERAHKMQSVPSNKMLTPKADWPLKMAPELYLERYPDGKHADLARQIVG